MKNITTACVLAWAALALAGCGSGDEAPPITTTEPTTTTETTTETATTMDPAPGPPPPVTLRISVRDGRPVGGIARPTVQRDDRVVLVVRSDVASEVHVHGYDLDGRVAPGSPARIRFRATIPGRFEIEMHAHPEFQIGELTVRP